jgi:hypothetical protein
MQYVQQNADRKKSGQKDKFRIDNLRSGSQVSYRPDHGLRRGIQRGITFIPKEEKMRPAEAFPVR